ncbi:unnamed protein product [Thelazia callipaeda]|uniref:Chitin-binding type-2 domain-containing protein n=1 Tax=Thelazia callipaeda TaxID=103827 RepID=A0A0N5D3E3_THECL|nr:unnamed protein product [Thelazia callipaeda]
MCFENHLEVEEMNASLRRAKFWRHAPISDHQLDTTNSKTGLEDDVRVVHWLGNILQDFGSENAVRRDNKIGIPSYDDYLTERLRKKSGVLETEKYNTDYSEDGHKVWMFDDENDDKEHFHYKDNSTPASFTPKKTKNAQVEMREETEPSVCVGQKNGVYRAAPCEQWYLSCYQEELKQIFCDKGLYWNNDEGRCEQKTKIPYCQLKYDCTGMHDGLYINGCSNVFWFCVGETVFLSMCPKYRYFNIKNMECDFKENISACKGIDENQVSKVVLPEKSNLESIKRIKGRIIQLMVKSKGKKNVCEKRKDGKYAIKECYRKYVFCASGMGLVVKCRRGQLFSAKHHRCMERDELLSCVKSKYTGRIKTAKHLISCFSLSDGTYSLGECQKMFIICRNESGRIASCSSGLVFNAQKGQCEEIYNVEKCARTGKAGLKRDIAQKMINLNKKQSSCQEKKNGKHAIRNCYEKYLFCIDKKGLIVTCRNGYLFSPEHDRCISKADLPFCAESGNEPINQSTKSSFSCSLPDGIYALGDCEKTYLVCSRGVGSNSSCKLGHAFNRLTRQCDSMFNIESCPQYKSQQKWNKLPFLLNRPDCRCEGRKDGLYSVGCTEKFYSCSNGISTGFECPNDLVFNPDGGFCDYPRNVAACDGQSAVQTFDKKEEGIASDVVSGCAILGDGIYGLSPCGTGYYHCWRGATSFAKCAFDLVFNPSLQRCDFKENVYGCSEYVEKFPVKSYKSKYRLTIIPVNDSILRCKELKDGFYAEGCSKLYYGCANSETFYMSCPPDLVFDVLSESCKEMNYVEACRNSTSIGKQLVLMDSHKGPLPSCSSLPNGPHQLAFCLDSYIYCEDGAISLASCPRFLVFNPQNSQCDLRGNVAACNEDIQLSKNESEKQCATKSDGIFSYVCSGNFYVCVKGIMFQFTCPNEMVYDSKFRQCRTDMEVENCTQITTSRAVLFSSMRNINSLDSTMKIKDSQADDRNVCNGRLDGHYEDRLCSNVFFACVNMSKILLSCPGALVYDATINRCEYPESIPQCRDYTTMSENILSKNQSRRVLSEERQSGESETLPLALSCKGRRDKAYIMDSCLNAYYKCYKEKLSVEYCQDNMVFDGSVVACVPKSICRRESSFLPPKFYMSKHLNTKIDGNLDLTADNMKWFPRYCRQLADGNYSAGCVANFIICTGGSGLIGKCPETMVFSNVLHRCVSYEECAFWLYRILISFFPSNRTNQAENFTSLGSSSVITVTSQNSEAKCSNSQDEHYTSECSSTYSVCVDGKTITKSCPLHMVFDSRSQQCTYHEVCENLIPSTLQTDVNLQQDHKQRGPIKTDSENRKIDRHVCIPQVLNNRVDSVKCDKLTNGLYGIDCWNEIVFCYHGVQTIRRCLQRHVFSPTALRCVHPSECEIKNHCGAGFIGITYLGKFKATKDDSPRISSGDNFTCTNKTDGNYGEHCAPTYFECSQQVTSLKRCKLEEVFDKFGNKCIPKDKCVASDRDEVRCTEGQNYEAGKCKDYYYKCSNNELIYIKCPNDHFFNASRGMCGIKCDFCECSDTSYDTDQTTVTTCNPGEIVPRGPCMDTYLKCSMMKSFEIKRCEKGKRFDTAQSICRFQKEVPECFDSRKESKIFLFPAFFHVSDSFQAPPSLNPQLRSIFIDQRDPKQHTLVRPHKDLIITKMSKNPVTFGMLKTFPSSVMTASETTPSLPDLNIVKYNPQLAAFKPASRIFNSLPNRRRLIKDTFRTNPLSYGYTPLLKEMNVGVIDHFHPPNNLQYVFPIHSSLDLQSPILNSTIREINEAASGKVMIDNVEGSGEDDNSFAVLIDSVVEATNRTKRDAFKTKFSRSALKIDLSFNSSRLCHNQSFPINIALGFCQSHYIHCGNQLYTSFILKCKSDDLFDDKLKKCVPAFDCKMRGVYSKRAANEETICSLLSDGIYALPGCNQHFISCISKRAILRSCPDGLFYDGNKNQCDYKEQNASCRKATTYERLSTGSTSMQMRLTTEHAVYEVPSILPNFACSVNSTVSLGCSPTFIVCAGGTAYIFSCDDDLVFDQA